LARSVTRIRSSGELKRKFKAGLSVLSMSPDDKVFDKTIASKVRELIPRAAYDVSS
jgi:hypothetical protein